MTVMKISDGGAEPQNTPQYQVVVFYKGKDWLICIDGLDCKVVDVRITDASTTVIVQPYGEDHEPVGKLETLDLFEIEDFHVY